MRILTTLITVLLLMQSTVCAGETWRFIALADWHGAEIYVQPNIFPGAKEQNAAGLKMLKENYGGELVMLPGDSNRGHWDRESFIKSFKPGLTPAEAILQAGELCYTGMVNAFNEAGYSRLLMAVGDHEVGDNPWRVGSAKSKHQAEFREALAKGFNIDPDTGQFIYDKPIGEAASRPLGTKYETTSFAYRYKNVLFVTVDVFYLSCNPHFHVLLPDGVYVSGADGTPTFVRAPRLTDDDVQQIVETTAKRVVCLLQRRGLLEEGNVDSLWEEEPLLATITAASVQGQVATGDRAGQRVRRRLIDPEEGVRSGPLCFASRGFSLHAATCVEAVDRIQLERLCRYVIRPPLAAGRLQILDTEQVVFSLKAVWSDGT